jgi:hypothetical protein
MIHAIIAFFVGATPACEVVVETYSGHVYVVGSGDTCADAWRFRGPIPADWRELRVERRSH